MVTMLVHGSDPTSALPERRKSHGRSTWMSETGSPRAILSTLHFLHAGHRGYDAAAAAAGAATATFISNSSHALTLNTATVRVFKMCLTLETYQCVIYFYYNHKC